MACSCKISFGLWALLMTAAAGFNGAAAQEADWGFDEIDTTPNELNDATGKALTRVYLDPDLDDGDTTYFNGDFGVRPTNADGQALQQDPLLRPESRDARLSQRLSSPTTATSPRTPVIVRPLSGSGLSFAQPGRGVGVQQRSRPDYEPLGIRMGSFLVYPSLESGIEYTDNLFESDGGESDDFLYVQRPRIVVESDFSNHEVGFEAGIVKTFHRDHSDQDILQVDARVIGRVDVVRSTSIDAEAGIIFDTEDGSSTDSPGGASEPTESVTLGGALGITHSFNRLSVSLRGSLVDIDFNDTVLAGGGSSNEDDRDRLETELRVRVAYEFSPNMTVFTEALMDNRDYDLVVDDGGENRDSNGFGVQAGLAFNLGRLANGVAGIGYLRRSYDDATLASIEALIFNADINWHVTALTTLRVLAMSTIEETTQNNSAGVVQHVLGIGIDHEWLRNLILGVDVLYTMEDFEGISRKDSVFEAALGLEYFFNRRLSARAGWRHVRRESNIAGSDFSNNIFGLGMQLQL